MSAFNFKLSTRAAVMALGVAAALTSVSAQAQVQPASVSLYDLIVNNGTVQSGDKLFSNFSYRASGFHDHASGYVWTNSAADQLAQAAQILVAPEFVGGNYGLEFTGEWHTHAGDSADAHLEYTVTVLDAGKYISDFHQMAVASYTGEASVKIEEKPTWTTTGFAIPVAPPGVLVSSASTSGGISLDDSAYTVAGFRPTSAVIITDITMAAMGNGVNESTLGSFKQTFSQSAVPEPSTYAMALAGLTAVGLFARRKNRAAA